MEALQLELNARWKSLDIVTKELVVMLLRCFSQHSRDTIYDGLPNYKAAVDRTDKELAERYIRFGQLKPGDRFKFFGHVYQKIEPDKVPLWVNCRGPGGERYLSDEAAVEKEESLDDTPDP